MTRRGSSTRRRSEYAEAACVEAMDDKEKEQHQEKKQLAEAARVEAMDAKEKEQHYKNKQLAEATCVKAMDKNQKEEHYKKKQLAEAAQYKKEHNPEARVTFATEFFDSSNPHNFENFTEDPETAALLYHANSGHLRFQTLEELCNDDGSVKEELLASFKEELNNETLTNQECEDLLFKYAASQGRSYSALQPSPELKKEHEKNQVPLQGVASNNTSDAPKLVCGSCGIVRLHGQYGKQCSTVALEELPDSLVLSGAQLHDYEELKNAKPLHIPLDNTNNLREVHLHKLKSVYESEHLQKFYHLHPEFVHVHEDEESHVKKEMTVLCPSCTQWLSSVKKTKDDSRDGKPTASKPPNSIAAGIDFGDPRRIGLVPLEPIELMIVAKIRHFHQISKVSRNHQPGERSDFTSNELRCHDIHFKHDAPIVASIALMFMQWESSQQEELKSNDWDEICGLFAKLLTIQLVGPQREMETMAKRLKMQTHLRARPWVVFQWLCVLQRVHPDYAADPQLEPCHFKDFKLFVEKCDKAAMATAIAVTDESVRNAEKVNGDDVARVRTGILTESDLRDIAKEGGGEGVQQSESSSSHSMNVSSAYVADASFAATHTSTASESPLEEQNAETTDAPKPSTDYDAKESLDRILQIVECFNVELPSSPDGTGGQQRGVEGGRNRKNSTCTHTKKKQKKNPDPSAYKGLHKSAWVSERDAEPMNEFQDMQELLVGAFPQIFLFGKTYTTKTSFPTPQEIEHLLLQYTNAAATNRSLLFYLFDCKSRHSIVQNMAAKIRQDPFAFQAYAHLVNSDEFKEKIVYAAQHPTSKQAKEVLKTVVPILNFGTRNTIFGGLGDTTSLSHAMAMARRYGPASTMLTVTPDDINSPTSFRLACNSFDNLSFPATVDETFFDKFQQGCKDFQTSNPPITIPLDYSSRKKASVDNPVAVAAEFRAMLENIITELVGCPLDFQPGKNSKNVRTWFFQSKKNNSPHHKGIFGHVTAVFGGIETQARGALHFHLLIWGSIPPKVLHWASYIPEIRAKVQAALDKMYCAQIPKDLHVKDMMLRSMKSSLSSTGPKLLPKASKVYSSAKHIPSFISGSQDSCKTHFGEQIIKTGIHDHTFTCHKPPQGLHRCRGCRPAGDSATTQPRFLEIEGGLNGDNLADKTLSQIVPTVMDEPPAHTWGNASTRRLRDYMVDPIPLEDNNELLMWELQRPLLEPLPPLPHEVQDVYDKHLEQQTGINQNHVLPSNSDDLLAQGKNFATQQLLSCIDIVRDGNNASTNFTQWLGSLESHTVIALYIELNDKIKSRNGMVVETNVPLQLATGSSTNAILLGSSQQSCCALFYAAPYVCKNKVALESCLSALEIAQRHIEQFPSTADDSGTDKRCVQHLFTRVLNSLSRSVEISDTQVALNLLNVGCEVTSDSFRYFGAQHCVNFFKHFFPSQHGPLLPGGENNGVAFLPPQQATTDTDNNDLIPCQKEQPKEQQGFSSDSDEDEILGCGVDDAFQAAPAIPSDHHGTGPVPMDFGPALFYTVKCSSPSDDDDSTCSDNCDGSMKVPLHYPKHWWYRGKQLRQLTQFEYHALVDILPLSKNDSADMVDSNSDYHNNSNTPNKPGQKQQQVFRFHPNHPLYHSHGQFLRAKQHTLIFNANTRPPKHPGLPPQKPDANAPPFLLQTYEAELTSWRAKATAFSTFYFIIFLPHENHYGNISCEEGEHDPNLSESYNVDEHGGEEDTHFILRDGPLGQDNTSTPNQSYPYLSWEAFCQCIHDMEHSPRAIDHARLAAMETYITGMQTNHVKRVLLNNFCHRNSTKWTSEEKREADVLFRSIGRNITKSHDPLLIEDLLTTKHFNTSAQANHASENAFCKKQMAAINMLFPPPSTTSTCSQQLFASSTPHSSSPLQTSAFQESLRVRYQPLELLGVSQRVRAQVCDVLDVAANIKTATLNKPSASQPKPSSNQQYISPQHQPTPPDPAILSLNKAKAEAYLATRNLSESQQAVAQHMLDYLLLLAQHKYKYKNANELVVGMQKELDIQPPHLLLTGEPGAGKSYAIETIIELANILDTGKVAATSYNGIAAVNIDGGTICSMWSIFDTSDNRVDINDDTVRLLRQALDSDELCILIVDELSTIDARIIALLNFRLQQIMNNDLDFGGLCVLFVGDFCQLGPVQKTFLPKDMMRWATRRYHAESAASNCPSLQKATSASSHVAISTKQSPKKKSASKTVPQKASKSMAKRFQLHASKNLRAQKKAAQKKIADEAKKCKPGSLTYTGCTLLSKFLRFHLLEQQRSKDPSHNSFVQHLSKGKTIQLSDILSYQRLSKQDIESNPEEWKYAPILVATNQERLTISRAKARLWAEEHKTYVFKWRCKTKRFLNRPPSNILPDLMEDHAFFWQFFVPGADAYINTNINNNLALVNGTQIKMHSLTLQDNSTYKHILSQAQLQDLPFGSEIEIDPPLAVNVVVVKHLDGKNISNKRAEQLNVLCNLSRQYSIDPRSHDIIIPLTVSISSSSKDWNTYSFCTGSPLSPISQVSVQEPFPFDLAFAMTVHKAQCRTIYRVVIDLTDHPFRICRMEYAAIFVAMSRVAHKSHLRLLEPNTVQSRESLYSYLEHLAPDPSIAPFLHGYGNGSSSQWDPSLALSYTPKPT